MNSTEISQSIDNYVRKNLSPKQEQRSYISEKYKELCGFLANDCFQSGSYARFTAIDPVHDLDVIYVLPDKYVVSNPQKVMDELRARLIEAYKGSDISKIKEITAQTHSVTIVFDDDAPEAFSIDVVPAVTVGRETNEFGESIYLVPEILKVNHQERLRRYEATDENPIGWTKSDPRGYISAATRLDEETNGTFRKAVKAVKAWRHKQKENHGDSFKLKSFHFELIAVEYFETNTDSNTLDAINGIITLLADRLDQPHYPDRADNTQYVDQYVADSLTDKDRQLILNLQQEADGLIESVASASSVTEVTTLLDKLTSTEELIPSKTLTKRVVVSAPSQPWSY